jgi:hypothetical protein
MHHDGGNIEDEHGDLLMDAAGVRKGGVSTVDESGDQYGTGAG